jgi:hypothetical protein
MADDVLASLHLFGQLSEANIVLYASVLQYLAFIIRYYRQNAAVRFIKSLVVSRLDLEARYASVQSAQSDLLQIAALCGAEKFEIVSSTVEKTAEEQATEKDEASQRHAALLDILTALNEPILRLSLDMADVKDGLQRESRVNILKAVSTIPYSAHHKAVARDRLQGSGAWLLRKPVYQDWRSSSSSSVLWLHGIPGSGKTKLVSMIIDELCSREHLAFFYCMRNPAEPHRAECDKILASLVRQLACTGRGQHIMRPVVEKYQDALDGFEGFEDHAWTKDECVDVLLALISNYPAVTLVLDALDEVNQEDRGDLMEAFSRILNESTSLVKLFMSSRDSYDIVMQLRGLPNVHINADDNAGDISVFV